MNSLLLILTIFVTLVYSTGSPTLQYDTNTTKDCVEWFNNGGSDTCSSVRSYFAITAQEFTKWNPSVSLDCKPWNYQSYCIVTNERLNKTATTTTSSKKSTTTTSSTSTLKPSPTSWAVLGCYVEDPKMPILAKNMNATGDTALTIPKCEDSCYRASYAYAGVQQGNQCWCGSYVGGEWAKNQTDCNVACTGNTKTFCGGKGRVNVFKAQDNTTPAAATTTGTPRSSSGSVVSTSIKSSTVAVTSKPSSVVTSTKPTTTATR